MYREISEELLSFLQKSPTAFHAVESIREELEANGFTELSEGKVWNIEPGKSYYVTRNDSSIMAFKLGEDLTDYNFQIAASHTDLPTFKIKENAEISVGEKYMKLNTEGYGGMICSTWFDRPLSVAGRVLVKVGDQIVTKLIAVDRDLLMIPSLAIHMNRQVNDGYAYNKQVDMLPLFGDKETQKGDFMKVIAQKAGVEVEDIYGSDLYLYNRMAPSIWGAREEFVSSPHLDDMQCGFATLKGFLKGTPKQSVNVFACFDNEEVGSGTKQGAASTFLQDVLMRINDCLGKTREEYYMAVANSFMVSADNAHAVHPNYQDKADTSNRPYMNEGIVMKSHAGQKYTSDGVSMAVFRTICERAEVPVQTFANRSDMAGGSTLGNIAMAQVSMNSVDIGLPQLAMHSSYETAGLKDTYYLVKAMEEFFDSKLIFENNHSVRVEK